MSEIKNTSLSPLALQVVKDISTHKYLDFKTEYCLDNDFTELGYRIRKIHTFIQDKAISLNKELDIQEERGIVNSEDDKLFVYLTDVCDKLLNVIECIEKSGDIYYELLVTIHKSVNSEKLDKYVPEEKA